MIDISIYAKYRDYSYSVSVDLGDCVFPMKLDIGANTTVVSLDAYTRNLNTDIRTRVLQYCEDCCHNKRMFTSASGDNFWGFPVVAHDVYIENVLFNDFYYYLVIENKRVISLIGVDFLDCCDYTHDRHQGIEISGFDSLYYQNTVKKDSIDTNDIIAIIDEMMVTKAVQS